jgi:hypothetical protein
MDKLEDDTESIRGFQYLEQQLNERIASFHGSVTWYRKRYYVSTMSTIVLSALITIIAGWNPSIVFFGIKANNFILLFSTTATVVSAWGAFFAPKESWLIYATTLNRFRSMQAKINFLKKSAAKELRDPEFIKILFKDYQSILNEHNKAWANLRSMQNKLLNKDPSKSGDH